ncbi:hypothetical protein FE257_000507 [Aspergillus nanangensis]|uniref:Uncharacterized protein n=1 Tax=Aspergillus nanangensis TaxID=2582783 RepID=A0AAD4GXN3_ASPNN|nr:hypothetical protein FE257_000507 [Aspergillus nanangensis]
MDSTERSRVIEWLETTEEDLQPAVRDTSSATTDAKLAGPSFQKASTFLEEDAEHLLLVPRADHMNVDDSLVPDIHPSANIAQGKERVYGLRQRHKIKPDRYDYKARVPTNKSDHSPNNKRKLSKKTRRHTINHDFHASNVPRSRLTIPSQMTTGIFKRGRTSSPIRSRQVPKPSFSELDFLIKNPNHHTPNLSQDNLRRGLENNQPLSNQSVHGVTHGCHDSRSKQTAYKADTSFISHNSSAKDKAESKVESTTREQTITKENTNYSIVGEKDSKVNRFFGQLENKQMELEGDELYETYTKNLLTFDLNAQDKYIHRKDEYCSLEDLKQLLLQRQRLWDSKGKYTLEVEHGEKRGVALKRPSSVLSETPTEQPPLKVRKLTAGANTQGLSNPGYDLREHEVAENNIVLYTERPGFPIAGDEFPKLQTTRSKKSSTARLMNVGIPNLPVGGCISNVEDYLLSQDVWSEGDNESLHVRADCPSEIKSILHAPRIVGDLRFAGIRPDEGDEVLWPALERQCCDDSNELTPNPVYLSHERREPLFDGMLPHVQDHRPYIEPLCPESDSMRCSWGEQEMGRTSELTKRPGPENVMPDGLQGFWRQHRLY